MNCKLSAGVLFLCMCVLINNSFGEECLNLYEGARVDLTMVKQLKVHFIHLCAR